MAAGCVVCLVSSGLFLFWFEYRFFPFVGFADACPVRFV
jgi:hypothetical protein